MRDLGSLLDREARVVRAGSGAYAAVMRRAGHRRRRRLVGTITISLSVAAAGLTMAILAFRTGERSRPGTENAYRGVVCRSQDEPGLITCRQAIDRALEESGSPDDFYATEADAALDSFAIHPGEDPTRIWAITYHEAITPVFGPPGREGPRCGVGDWRINIHARTGKYISEGGSAMATPCPSEEESGWTTLEIQEFRSSIELPPGWHTQRFRGNIGLAYYSGILVTNVDVALQHPDLGPGELTSAWDMRGLPSNAVVIEFSRLVRLSGCLEGHADTPFPLSLEDAREIRSSEDVYGAPEPRYWRPFTVDGDPHYAVNVWLGAEASQEDRALAEQIVGSIEKPTGLSCP
jgi:hypothetical protein